MSEKQIVYKVTRPDCGKQWCIYSTWDAVAAEFDGAEDSDVIHVQLARMTPEEVAALPEFEGW